MHFTKQVPARGLKNLCNIVYIKRLFIYFYRRILDLLPFFGSQNIWVPAFYPGDGCKTEHIVAETNATTLH